MARDFKQLVIRKTTPALWRVTFKHAPINLVDYETLDELDALVADLENSSDVKVVVFDSADPDFFLAHWDVAAKRAQDAPQPAPTWTDIGLRLARAPFVSIALIRGRARGMGHEITLGFDMRFASAELAVLGQPEVGIGMIPGGGSLERLPLLAGRARALEIVLGAADHDAATAERYGWINRAVPDKQLDQFVDELAQRIASFDKPALAEAKRLLSRNALPESQDLEESNDAFHKAFAWPGTQARAKTVMQLGMGTRGDLEMRLGEYLPTLLTEHAVA